MLSIVIPTRWYWPKPIALIESILLDSSINWVVSEILCVVEFDKTTLWREKMIEKCKKSGIMLKVIAQYGYWVSASRNYGASIAIGELVIFIDDDTTISEGFIWNMVDEYNMLYKEHKIDIMLYPTVLQSDTDRVYSRWYRYYNRLLARPVAFDNINNRKDKLRRWLMMDKLFAPKYGNIKLSNVICVLTSKKVTDQVKFDEDMLFVYEDLDRTYRVYKSGHPIFVSEQNTIKHYEWYRTKMEQMYIWNKESIYYKTRHRIWFAIKNSNLWQKILYYICWFWISNIWTLVMILRYSEKRSLHLLARWRGIKDGLKLRNQTIS